MILADKIIMLRKKSGMSQEELAEKMNVSRQSVSKWEGAQSVPDLDKILKLSRLFGVSTDYLLKEEQGELEYIVTDTSEEISPVRRVSMEEANEFLRVKAAAAGHIALAAFLCILSPICLIALGAAAEAGLVPVSEDFAGAMGLIVLVLMVVPAVAIFISCGTKTSPYEYLEKEIFETEYGVSGMVRERKEQYREHYNRGNVLGACLCILSAIPLFASSFVATNDFGYALGLAATIVMAGVGVTFFIRVGIPWASMEKLLQEGEYTRERKRRNPVADAIAGVYWLLTTALYLGYSLYTNDWGRSWILWPVAGVLFAAVMILCNAFQKRGR